MMLNASELIFEVHDNFQKQTYRNRCYIYGANGKQLLNIPIQKQSGKQLTKDIKIDYSANWQAEHYKSLLSAYSSSPFFEYYIDDLKSILTNKETFLLDLNIKTFLILQEVLQEDISYTKSTIYNKERKDDFRILVNAKKELTIDLTSYTQVFNLKHGFIANLSMLDLLFMEGPSASIYLEKVPTFNYKN